MAHSWCLGSQLRLLLCNISFLLLIWTYVSWKLARYHFLSLSLSLYLCLSPMKMLLFPLSLTGGKARRLMRNREGEKYADGAYMVWYVCQLLLHILKCAPPLRRHTHLRCPVFLTISPSKKIVENHTYYSIDNINIH